MKFLSLFAAGAIATSVVKRDSASIITALGGINTQVTALNSAIQAITGPGDRDAVLAASKNVLDAIASASSTASASGTLELGDALSLTPAVNTLTATVTTAIDSIIAKKDIITQAGLAGTALAQLQAQQSASSGLIDVIVGKVVTDGQSLARRLAQPLVDQLNRGVSAYAGSTDGTGSSGSSSASSASSAASSAASSVSSSVASSIAITSSYGASSAPKPTATVSKNGTATTYPTGPVYTGAAAANVAGFGGILAAAALVAAF